MPKRNMGPVDRAMRAIVGLVLLLIGLAQLGGMRGDVAGIVVALLGVMALAIAATGFHPFYHLIGLSHSRPARAPVRKDGLPEKNMGRTDRAIHAVFGLVILGLGLMQLGGVQGAALGVDVGLLGVWVLIVAAIGYNPIYRFAGLSSREAGQ